MPPVPLGEYLLSYLYEIGPTMPAGMGPASITNQEVAAWQELTGITLQPWEGRFLRKLSREYVSELMAATKPDRKAPWQPSDEQIDRADVAKSLRKSIAVLAKL